MLPKNLDECELSSKTNMAESKNASASEDVDRSFTESEKARRARQKIAWDREKEMAAVRAAHHASGEVLRAQDARKKQVERAGRKGRPLEQPVRSKK
jgi:hypothetical protein